MTIESIYENGYAPDTNNIAISGGHGHGNQSYAERNNRNYNLAEEAFEALCVEREVKFNRCGFDEKNGKVPNFFTLNPLLRHLPDYIVNFENKKTGRTETRVIAVKGTNKFKEEDYNRLDWMDANFGSDRAPLWFVFYIKGEFFWRTIAQVRELYETSTSHGSWEVDGKNYRTLTLKAS